MAMNKIRSLDDLKKVGEQAREAITVREGGDVKVAVGMGTCGIAAGAREVVSAVINELAERNVKGVSVTQTGCAGSCEHEPLLTVSSAEGPHVTYANVSPDQARKIIVQHVINGEVLDEWVLAEK